MKFNEVTPRNAVLAFSAPEEHNPSLPNALGISHERAQELSDNAQNLARELSPDGKTATGVDFMLAVASQVADTPQELALLCFSMGDSFGSSKGLEQMLAEMLGGPQS